MFIFQAIPWSFKAQDPQTGEFFWTGYCADFAQKISEVMNFDYVFVEPATGTFGEKVNGTWDGIVGDLAVGVGPLLIYVYSLRACMFYLFLSVCLHLRRDCFYAFLVEAKNLMM